MPGPLRSTVEWAGLDAEIWLSGAPAKEPVLPMGCCPLPMKQSVLPYRATTGETVQDLGNQYWQSNVCALGGRHRDGLDLCADSGARKGTGRTAWTNQMALRSRWRRFESCRGRHSITCPEATRLFQTLPKATVDQCWQSNGATGRRTLTAGWAILIGWIPLPNIWIFSARRNT